MSRKTNSEHQAEHAAPQRHALDPQLTRVEASEELRRKARTFEALMDATAELVVMIDYEGRCRYVNPAALRALERPAEELLGRTCREAGISPGPWRASKATLREPSPMMSVVRGS